MKSNQNDNHTKAQVVIPFQANFCVNSKTPHASKIKRRKPYFFTHVVTVAIRSSELPAEGKPCRSMRDDFVRVCAIPNSNWPIPFGIPVAKRMPQYLQHRDFTLCPERLRRRDFALNLLHMQVFSNHFTWKGKSTFCTTTQKDRVNDVLDLPSPNPYFKTYFKSFIDENYSQFLD